MSTGRTLSFPVCPLPAARCPLPAARCLLPAALCLLLCPIAHGQDLEELEAQYIRLYEAGKYVEAQRVAESALAAAERLHRDEPIVIATCQFYVGACLAVRGRNREAEPWLKKALATGQRVLGPNDPKVAVVLSELGLVHMEMGRETEAEQAFDRAIKIYRARGVKDEDSREGLPTPLYGLGYLRMIQGQYGKSEPLFKQAIDIVEQNLGKNNRHVGTAFLGLVDLYLLQGRIDDANQAAGALTALWQILVPQAQREAIVQGKYKRLVIIPDGSLSPLPFEILVTGQEPRTQYLLDAGPPVLYAPSATILLNLVSREKVGTTGGREPVLHEKGDTL